MNQREIAGFLCGLLLLVGCEKDDGRYNLSGNVTIDGKPVPTGELILEPDAKAGNQGPPSMTQIADGKYSLSGESGIVGGNYNVTVIAFDGVAFGDSIAGKALLKEPYLEQVEFPKEDSTRDFEIKRGP